MPTPRQLPTGCATRSTSPRRCAICGRAARPAAVLTRCVSPCRRVAVSCTACVCPAVRVVWCRCCIALCVCVCVCVWKTHRCAELQRAALCSRRRPAQRRTAASVRTAKPGPCLPCLPSMVVLSKHEVSTPSAGLRGDAGAGTALAPYQAEFIEFAMGLGVLKFGSAHSIEPGGYTAFRSHSNSNMLTHPAEVRVRARTAIGSVCVVWGGEGSPQRKTAVPTFATQRWVRKGGLPPPPPPPSPMMTQRRRRPPFAQLVLTPRPPPLGPLRVGGRSFKLKSSLHG